MDITWYGLSCFRIRERGITVVCDPFEKKTVGLALPRIRADIVTVSHARPGHSHVRGIAGHPKVLTGPGEYEIREVFIFGLAGYHKVPEGQPRERNVAFFLDFDGLMVGHLGDLGELPPQSQLEDLGEVHILMVPVGGHRVLEPSRITDLIGFLEPRLVIPMHYRHPGLRPELAGSLEPLERLLKELGVNEPERMASLRVSKSNLPEETQVVVLEPQAATAA